MTERAPIRPWSCVTRSPLSVGPDVLRTYYKSSLLNTNAVFANFAKDPSGHCPSFLSFERVAVQVSECQTEFKFLHRIYLLEQCPVRFINVSSPLA